MRLTIEQSQLEDGWELTHAMVRFADDSRLNCTEAGGAAYGYVFLSDGPEPFDCYPV